MNAPIRQCLWALFLIWTAGAAQANCGVIDTLDKLHSVETRLLRNSNSPLFSSEIRYLTNQARQLSGSSVTDGLGANPMSDKGATFLYFVYYAKKLALEVSIDDPATAMRNLANPAMRENLGRVGSYLDDMRCTPAEIADAPAFPVVVSDQIDIDFLVARAFVAAVFNMRNVAIALFVAACALVWSQMRQGARTPTARQPHEKGKIS